MNQVPDEVAVVGQRAATREAGVQLVEERDALLAVLPAEQHRPPMQLAAEVDEPVGGLHFDSQLRHLAQDLRRLPVIPTAPALNRRTRQGGPGSAVDAGTPVAPP